MEFRLKDEFIKLGQLLKAVNVVENGAIAKIVIQDGEVLLNGEVCTQRGKKIVPGDVVEFDGEIIKVIANWGFYDY